MSDIYKESDWLQYTLENRFLQKKKGDFPLNDEINIKIYKDTEDYLYEKVHEDVCIGAALHGDGLLNDHGKGHIKTVIQRAGLILEDRIEGLIGYEIFILLLAIHFHDVGNIFGRDDHEKKIFEVMGELKLSFDNATIRQICDIAMAHGGYVNNNKDTIIHLPTEDYLNGIKIRPSLLAAILRFSDEIADDYSRASRFLDKLGVIPPQNKVFHDLSNSLQPPAISGDTLILKFEIPYNLAISKSTKIKSIEEVDEIYLYDEIINRLRKCIIELEYCRKYSHGFILINGIHASITVFYPESNRKYSDNIRLRLSGYPESNKCIDDLCETPIKAKDGEQMRKIILDEGRRE
jgi:hypothetical protein